MRPRASIALAAALAGAVASACGLLGLGHEPPPARGVLLVLATGYEGGGAGAPRGTPALARLAAAGRAFDAAYAPDPDAARAREALVGGRLVSLLRARGVATAGLGEDRALPVERAALELSAPGPVTDADSAARLRAFLRDTRGRFALLAAVGGEPLAPEALPPLATLAGAFAPPLPRIAVTDLGFSERPGAAPLLLPLASEPARQRAAAARLERALAADRELGRLVELVEREAPGTAVIVVGDPPPDGGRHGRLERRDALFDDTLRSALVVSTPGLARPGRSSPRLVSTLDTVPTLLALLGLPPSPAGAGRSLMPLLARPAGDAPDEAVSSVPRRAGRLGRSVRTERFRYTEWPDGSRELYDHDADPAEITNLAARPDQQARIEELGRLLRPGAAANGSPVEPAAAATSARGGLPRARHVVLIVVDDLNTRLGAWGAAVRTPAIDRLAARGVRFERAYAQVAMCNPSRVSMLTGWAPERTGVWQNEDPPRPAGAVPLQERLAARGARTASIGKIYHSPADFRWDLREEQPEVVEERDPTAAGEGMSGLWVKAPGGDLDQPDGRRARRAAALVDGRGERPLFLALGIVRPHLRWVAPERYFGFYPPDEVVVEPYPDDDLADVPAIAVKTQPQPLPGLTLLGREPPGLARDLAQRREVVAAYQACVSFADAQVGVVLDALDRRDAWQDTVVVLVGDNGFHLGEHGGMLRKDTLFEEALRVPLVVAAPGLPHPGGVVRTPVELLDVYPTIVELLGEPLPSDLDGRSLVPLLVDPQAPGRGFARSWRRVQPPERGHSLRTARLRYTLWPDGSEELYDRRADRAEAENLAARAEWSGEKKRLRGRLEALVAPLPGGR